MDTRAHTQARGHLCGLDLKLARDGLDARVAEHWGALLVALAVQRAAEEDPLEAQHAEGLEVDAVALRERSHLVP